MAFWFQKSMEVDEYIPPDMSGKKRSMNEMDEACCSKNKEAKDTCLTCDLGHQSSKMTHLKDVQVWQTILSAAKIRNYVKILKMESGDEVPQNQFYNSECRKKFCHKKSLERIKQTSQGKSEVYQVLCETRSTRSSGRCLTQNSNTYSNDCIFCDKKVKYLRGGYRKDKLVRASDLRADKTLRQIATSRCDSKLLQVTANDIVAKEAHYHRTCYRMYTQTSERNASNCDESDGPSDKIYECASAKAHKDVFDHIRSELFGKEGVTILALCDLMKRLCTKIKEYGTELHESTRSNFRRALENEFGSSIAFVKAENGRVFIMDKSIDADKLAQELLKSRNEFSIHMKTCKEKKQYRNTALYFRNLIQSIKFDKPWPPLPEELDENYIPIPHELLDFLHTLLEGVKEDETGSYKQEICLHSIAQDIIYTVTNGKIKPAKHILLAWVVKALTGNIELINILNHLGQCVSRSKLEEIITALVTYKCGEDANDAVPLPQFVQQKIMTCLGFDNIDRNEETLDGGHTSHRVNGIIVQPDMSIEIQRPKRKDIPQSKKRSVETTSTDLSPYISGGRKNPPAIAVNLSANELPVVNLALQKNTIWTLLRQINPQQQTISAWTGFNIKTRNNVKVSKDNIGYLPTINAPPTKLATVQEILRHCLSIKDKLELDSIICVADQAIYSKLVEIVNNNYTLYQSIVLRMGGFHTCCNLLSIIGK